MNELNDIITRAVQRRSDLAKTTNALRLVNGKDDGLPGVTIDRYNQHFVAQVFNQRQKENIKALAEVIKQQFDPAYLVVIDRASSSGRNSDHPKTTVLVEKEKPKTVVEENGLKFVVNLNDSVNTGLSLEMRSGRQLIGKLCRDKEVLNCFASTCAFGVYARWDGAARVVNIDTNRKILDKGMENYRLNRIEPAKTEFTPAETMKYLQRSGKKENAFDIIILDPPVFSRYEKKVFVVKHDLPKLIELALPALKPAGHLFVSTNFSEITSDDLKEIVRTQAVTAQREVSQISVLGQDGSFPDSGTMQESHLAVVLATFK